MNTAEDPFIRTVTVMPVAEISQAVAWYKLALGLETVYLHEGDSPDEPTNYAVLRRGRVEVHLVLDEPPPHRQSWTNAGTGYLYLFVYDVESVFREVTNTGVKITRGLETENWGARGFNLTDPSGNAIHIEQPPC